jgi:hypothetical protein
LAHFWLHFWIIFIVWQKNDYKMKQKMKPKMVTVNAPKRKHLENGTKMHFTWTSAVLASAWHFQTPPQRTCMKLKNFA